VVDVVREAIFLVAVVVAVCCRLSSSAKVLSGWGCCRQLIVRHRFEEPLLIVRHRFEEPLLIVRHRFEEPLLVTRVPGKLDTNRPSLNGEIGGLFPGFGIV
jgi:hypothetical protein